MYYINIILATLLLASCASTDNSIQPVSSGKPPTEPSDIEREKYNQAINLLNNDKLEDARVILTEFVSGRPELAGPYANLAMIELRQKNYPEAVKYIKTALDKNPNLPQALNIYAYLEQVNGNIQVAEENYLKAIKYNEKYSIAHYNLALLYDVYLQDIPKAIKYYESYLKLVNNSDQKTMEWLQQLKNTAPKG